MCTLIYLTLLRCCRTATWPWQIRCPGPETTASISSPFTHTNSPPLITTIAEHMVEGQTGKCVFLLKHGATKSENRYRTQIFARQRCVSGHEIISRHMLHRLATDSAVCELD